MKQKTSPLDDEDAANAVFPELRGCALIRELHVYGQMVPTIVDPKDAKTGERTHAQHVGFGKRLMRLAEEIAFAHDFGKIAVIAGVGVRNFYRKIGYEVEGASEMMIKTLSTRPIPLSETSAEIVDRSLAACGTTRLSTSEFTSPEMGSALNALGSVIATCPDLPDGLGPNLNNTGHTDFKILSTARGPRKENNLELIDMKQREEMAEKLNLGLAPPLIAQEMGLSAKSVYRLAKHFIQLDGTYVACAPGVIPERFQRSAKSKKGKKMSKQKQGMDKTGGASAEAANKTKHEKERSESSPAKATSVSTTKTVTETQDSYTQFMVIVLVLLLAWFAHSFD
jgi:hypothetical protein